MKNWPILMLFFSVSIFAQGEGKQIDLQAICLGENDVKDLVIIDNGFCNQYLKLESEDLADELLITLDEVGNLGMFSGCDDTEIAASSFLNKKSDKWKLRLYAGHSSAEYSATNLRIKSSRYDILIKDYQWAARSSDSYFNPSVMAEAGNNPAQAIDEPSNTFTASLEKNGHEFFISAFHSKFFQKENQLKHVQGTVDGVPVDGIIPIDQEFLGKLKGNENTHRQYSIELGYGHRFKLMSGKLGSLSFIPSLGLGIMAGHNLSLVALDEDDGIEQERENYKVQGIGGSITNRFEFNSPKERIGVFVENKLAIYHQKHDFMDGAQEYDLAFISNSVGIKFMIYNPNNRRAKALGRTLE